MKRKCKWCGEYMYFRPGDIWKDYCSKECSEQCHKHLYNAKGNGPWMPPLDASRISDEGYTLLVKAIVNRASEDVTNFSPESQYRKDAEKFFKSDLFGALTGLEGEPILRSLREEYKRRHEKKKQA